MIAARRASLQTEIICRLFKHREQLPTSLQGEQNGRQRQGAERGRKTALVSIKSDDLNARIWRLILVSSCHYWDRLELRNFTSLVAHQHNGGVAVLQRELAQAVVPLGLQAQHSLVRPGLCPSGWLVSPDGLGFSPKSVSADPRAASFS